VLSECGVEPQPAATKAAPSSGIAILVMTLMPISLGCAETSNRKPAWILASDAISHQDQPSIHQDGRVRGDERSAPTATAATPANSLFPRGSVGRPGGDNRVTLRAATAVDLTAVAVAQTIN
jgi:hypothetical protein